MKARRIAAGLTLQAVGDAMGGKTRAYVHALETGYGPHPMRWTADVTRRYLAALATAVATAAATRVTRSAPEQAQQRGEPKDNTHG